MVGMKIELPDDLTDEERAAIFATLIQHGGSIIDIETVKQTAWARFIDWWYRLVRRIKE
jgi:hypothetical protein